MQSASWFSKTLYRKNMSRFWPLWAGYGVIWFFSLPVYLLIDYSHAQTVPHAWEISEYILDTIRYEGIAMAAVFGLLAAMAVWSYLFNSRATGMLHALPVRREGMFVSNWLAGMSFLILPNAAIFLLTLGAEAIVGTVEMKWLLLWFLIQSLLCLFFFSFATICAFFTGHILALPALYGIFNGLFWGMGILVETVLRKLIYGYGGLSDWMTTVCKLGTPVYGLNQSLKIRTSYNETLQTSNFLGINGLDAVTIYALVGVVFSVLALFLYRKRALELAGEVIAVSALSPVFKYGVAFCGALAGGSVLYAIFQFSLLDTAGFLILFLLVSGAVFYFVAEILLKKSFRVFRSSWRGCAVFVAVLAVCAAAVELDVFGFESWVPSQEKVAKITLHTNSTMPYDSYEGQTEDSEEGIRQAIALQQALIQEKDRMESGVRSFYIGRGEQVTTADGVWTENASFIDVTLTYAMKNGKTATRSYQLYICKDDLKNGETPAGALLKMLNRPEAVQKAYFPEWLEENTLVGGEVDYYDLAGAAESSKSWNLDKNAAQTVLRAVKEDIDAGRIGTRWLLTDKDYLSKVYENSVRLTFCGVFPEMPDEKDAKRAYITQSSDVSGETYVMINIVLRTDSASTLAALKNLGALENGRSLRTQEQRMMKDGLEIEGNQESLGMNVVSPIPAD